MDKLLLQGNKYSSLFCFAVKNILTFFPKKYVKFGTLPRKLDPLQIPIFPYQINKTFGVVLNCRGEDHRGLGPNPLCFDTFPIVLIANFAQTS